MVFARPVSAAGSADSPEPIDSYYLASGNAFPEQAPLGESIACDVCVVGGGITGCSAALHLAERGYDVVLLESAQIAWGASGRNGGQAGIAYACSMATLREQLGAQDARRLWGLSLEALALLKARIRRHAIACDLKPGVMLAALKARQRRELLALRREQEAVYDYVDGRLLEGEALRATLASERYIAALYDPNSAHLHPLNYTRGLAQAALAAGVRIFERSRVQRVGTGAGPLLITAQGRVRCRYAVLAGNAYLGGLLPALRAKIMPVGTYIAATETLGEARARALIANDAAVADTNFVLDYYRCSADHRLLFGGRVSYSTLPPPNLKAHMRARMLKVFPQLGDVRIDYAWGGFVAITMNRAPHFGRIGANVYFAQGFSGHGLALTGLAGQLIAEAVAGEAERFELFTRIRHRSFPGGRALRTPLLVLAMLYYRLRDCL